MSALDKVLLAAAGEAPVAGDAGTDLVAAAATLLDHAIVTLAWADDGKDDDDDDENHNGTPPGKDDGKTGGGKCPGGVNGCKGGKSCHHKPKGGDEKANTKGSDTKKQKAKLTALAAVAAARLALSGLSTEDATENWVQATSVSAALALSQVPPGRPETYADPGFQGRARFPLDADRIHISLAAFAAPANRAGYTQAQQDRIWNSIKAAAARHGVGMDTLVALAAPGPADAGAAMNHAPFTGKHSHAHHTQTVVTTAHHHNDDNRHGGRGGYGGDW